MKNSLMRKLLFRLITPIVKKLANRANFKKFNEDPALFFSSLKNPKYRFFGKIFFPVPKIDAQVVSDEGADIRAFITGRIQAIINSDLFLLQKNILISGNGSESLLSMLKSLPDSFLDEHNLVWVINNVDSESDKGRGIASKFYMPWLMLNKDPWRWDEKRSFSVSRDDAAQVRDIDYLKEACDNIKSAYPNIDGSYATLLLLETERYYTEIFTFLKPELIIVWNQFTFYNRIARALAQKHKIPVMFAENGNLPGTYNFDTVGEMGESLPARNPEWLLEKPVSAGELKRAAEVLQYLRTSGINRKKQPFIDKAALRSSLRADRPVLFYAGQYDLDSGIFPYTANSRARHSPSFSSSYEAMLFLAELAKRNAWNLIFKPHPMSERFDRGESNIPANVIFVPKGNINEIVDLADVVITILSTTAYVALIREKPVVMLGYIHLRGQGCTYEAFERGDIEKTMQNAIENGYTPEQREAFLRHTARMCKYYLFNENRQQKIPYGRPVAEFLEYLKMAMAGTAPY